MRKSILTDYDNISAFSGKPKECVHHLIMGISSRKLSDEDGLYIPLTNGEHNCSPNGRIFQIHDNPAAEKLSKMLGQVAWEKEYLAKELEKCGYDIDDIKDEARTHFMARYGQSFL